MSKEKPYVRADAQGLLALLGQVERQPLAEQSLEQARASYLALHKMADRPPRDLAFIRDLNCPGPAGDIPLRVYDVRENREPSPVIMFYHGGGYVIGDLETHHALCTEIAAQMDLPVIATDYRLSPEHPFPAAVNDCEAAARWVAASPGELGFEATSLITMGDSAGGNAAAVTTQSLSLEHADVPVLLQVLIVPSVGAISTCASLDEFADGFILTREAVEFFEASYCPNPDDRRANPHLGPLETSPPSIVVSSSLDPIRDMGRDYAAALAKAGVDHIFLEMSGLPHSFANLRQSIPSAQTEMERIFETMKLMLQRNETS